MFLVLKVDDDEVDSDDEDYSGFNAERRRLVPPQFIPDTFLLTSTQFHNSIAKKRKEKSMEKKINLDAAVFNLTLFLCVVRDIENNQNPFLSRFRINFSQFHPNIQAIHFLVM